MNEFKKRLLQLKGNTSLNAFSTKCKIPYSTMRGYVEEDAEPKLDNLIKIAKAFETSVGWLVGEEQNNVGKKYRGIEFERHIEIGEELKEITFRLNGLCVEFNHAYPASGRLSRATKYLGIAYDAVVEARGYAEENLFEEHKDSATPYIYYSNSSLDHLMKKRDRSVNG